MNEYFFMVRWWVLRVQQVGAVGARLFHPWEEINRERLDVSDDLLQARLGLLL